MGADPTILERNGFTDRRVCRFSVLSLIYEFIISHLVRFVKYFFYFFWCDGLESNQHSTTTQAMGPATLKDHHIMSGFCSRHIPNIVSACGVWFTFVYRYTYTPCGRVIGLKILPTLVGLSLWDCLTLAFCTLIVSQLGRFVKGFPTFSQNFFFESTYARATLAVASIRLRLPSPLDTLIVSHIGRFVKGFFRNF